MDDDYIGTMFRTFLLVIVGLVLVFALGYAIWYFTLRADTSMQGVVRTNTNTQAGQQIANNSYLHSLLSTIETDKQGLKQFYSNLDTFCQLHQTTRVGSGCKNASHITDYNDQQEYQRSGDNITAAETSFTDDINKYNAYFSNSDVIGLDASLPHHINQDGTFRKGQ